MKRLFTKSISLAFLCMLLTVLMIFSGCNSGSKATNFFESIQELQDVQKYDFEVDVNFKSGTQSAVIEIDGTYNNEKSMMATATVKSGAMTIKLGEIIFDGNRIYIDIKELLSTMGSSAILDGKDYIYIDLKELTSLAAMSGAEMPDLTDLSAYTEASKTITNKLYEILGEAAKDVKPEILGKDGNKFTLTINEENFVDYIRNIVYVLVDEQDWIVSTLPELLEDAGLSEVADLIYDNESDIIDALETAAEEVKEDPEISFSADEGFEISAYSEMTTDGGRAWDIGMEISMMSPEVDGLFTLNGNSADLSFNTTITENAGDKPITEVDEDNAISFMTVMMSSMSSMPSTDDSTDDLYSSLI